MACHAGTHIMAMGCPALSLEELLCQAVVGYIRGQRQTASMQSGWGREGHSLLNHICRVL